MSIHDLIHIRRRYSSIPNRLGIDDDVRAMLALVQAARFVGANLSFQTTLRHRGLKQLVEFPGAIGIATPSWMSGIALIGADKDMPVEFCHRGDRITHLAVCAVTRQS